MTKKSATSSQTDWRRHDYDDDYYCGYDDFGLNSGGKCSGAQTKKRDERRRGGGGGSGGGVYSAKHARLRVRQGMRTAALARNNDAIIQNEEGKS